MNEFVLANACYEQVKKANGDMLAYLRDTSKAQQAKDRARTRAEFIKREGYDALPKTAASLPSRKVLMGVGGATLLGGAYGVMRKDGPVRKALDSAGVQSFKKQWKDRPWSSQNRPSRR